MRESLASIVARTLVILLLIVWSAVPVALVVLSSFKPTAEIFTYPPTLVFEPTLEHYRTLFEKWPDFIWTLRNSAVIALSATALTLVASVLAGYVYSRYRGGALAGSALFMVAIRLLPPIVITLPLYPVADFLALSDSYTILILLYATFFVSLGSMILKTFIDSIPDELDQAATIDGASEMQILRRVIVPLSAQGMVAASVFVFVYAWNEYLFAFIFTTTKAKTAPVVISEMMGSLTGVDWGLLFAAATVQLVPVVAFVALVQKFLIAGLTAGSVKG
ncbi:carbohydrate ABC transporter permease [Alsobacter sp. SYSU M60028]|uniref:Carbohydrate ABC transporter permease n=1 Tax=Alsobacter ponti TaxID=2962936 RepID=A0ABT1LAP8_9HYPH|nr:carbohydrate ABC transporter permease [Alsobacter ponti]MCP8938567.1 carbohydrate ABC transporter permease [Alsobacter ponti]